MRGIKSDNPVCREYITRLNHLWTITLQLRREAITPRELSRSHKKFNADGTVLPYYGLTIIAPVEANSSLYANLQRTHSNLRERFAIAGLGNKAAFLPPETFHMTVSGLEHQRGKDLSESRKNEIIESIQKVFAEISSSRMLLPLQFTIGGLALHGRTVLVARAYPASDQDFLGLQELRAPLRPAIGREAKPFTGHITFAYLVKTCSPEELDAMVSILEVYADQVFGSLLINELELRHFSSMADYGRGPITSLSLG